MFVDEAIFYDWVMWVVVDQVWWCYLLYNSKDNGAGVDYTIKKIGPMSPTHSKSTVHELYRQIQKGGLIPQHGLQLSPAETRRGT